MEYKYAELYRYRTPLHEEEPADMQRVAEKIKELDK